ncbi:ATP-binding protein [Pseudomonadota bacterium]
MAEEIEVLPDPERLIEGLRDTGYEFNTAVADIVDNSIAASASLVDIKLDMDFRGNVRLSIADNGHGMNRDDLLNAMKYGSERRPDPASLGKFGLGLKTASTAFCRRLSVVSRDAGDAPLLQATWDLDHVAHTRKWELLLSDVPDEESIDHLTSISPDAAGTVIVWENIDRLMKTYQNPGGAYARNALQRLRTGLIDHIAMTYQRFLDKTDSRAHDVEIGIDGMNIEPWDPYCSSVADLVAQETVPVELGRNHDAEFQVRAYILPRKEEFPDEESARRAKLSNERQGIYIYRENRLIHEADWLGMFSKEPHGTLLRVEFSFNHRLDEAFHIDIKKSQIILNEDLWNWLKDEFLTAPRREANNRYRQGIRRQVAATAVGSHDASNRNIESKEDDLPKANVTVLDPNSGDCEVSNSRGQFRLKLSVGTSSRPGEVFVQAVDGLDDNLLFKPAIIDGHQSVKINTAHPYYHKVYVPNLSEGVTIQGMDSLLWGLCVSELSTISDATSTHFEEMRFELSRLLRKLVEDLPDPAIDEDAAA